MLNLCPFGECFNISVQAHGEVLALSDLTHGQPDAFSPAVNDALQFRENGVRYEEQHFTAGSLARRPLKPQNRASRRVWESPWTFNLPDDPEVTTRREAADGAAGPEQARQRFDVLQQTTGYTKTREAVHSIQRPRLACLGFQVAR